MRRLSLTAAAIVSTAVLLTTTSVFAIAPAKVNMGTLKPQGTWKVGTVDQGGEHYCAMVGTYNNKVVAAFARNPQGLGSLALDFGDAMFTPGKSYDVSLAADGTQSRTFKGRASTERSLVVQIGKDGSFYDALSKNGTLGIDMSTATLRLDLAKFSDSHKDLVACASQLTSDEQTAEPQQRTAELPIDRELAELSQARTKLAAASTKADDIQKTIQTKSNSLDALEAQLEAEARAEIEKSKTNIASIDSKQKDVREKLAAKGVTTSNNPLDLSMVEPAAGTPDLPTPSATTSDSAGRKLLAAIGGNSQLAVPPSTGSSSRDIEARELGLADASRAAAETAKALELKNEIASIEAEKNAQAQKTMADFDARQKELDAQGSKLAEKRDSTLAKLSAAAAAEDSSKKMRADVIAQQAKIAEVGEAKKKEVEDLPRQLAATQSQFEARIAALEAERNQLRDQVNSVVAENDRLKKTAAQGKPEDRLEIAQLKKQMLEMDTQRQAEIARAAAAQKELDAARQQIASLRQGSQDEMARLANLQRTLETERAQLNAERGAVESASNAAVLKATGEVEAMRQSLSQKQAELEAATKQSAEASNKADRDLDVMRQALAKKQAELETIAMEQGAEAKRLQGEKDSIEAAKLAFEQEKSSQTKSENTVLASSQKLVDSQRAELETLRGRIQTLETDLAKAREQAAVASAAVAAAPKPVDEAANQAAKAEMARLKEENASLRDRLASMLSIGKNDKTAEVTAPVQPQVETPVVAAKEDVKPVQDKPQTVAVAEPASAQEKTNVVETKVEEVAVAAPAPVAAKTEAQSDAQGSPVLASLFGKRAPADPTAEQVKTQTASLSAQELNASEPAAGEPELSSLPGNDKRMPAVPPVEVERENVAVAVKPEGVEPAQPVVAAVAEKTEPVAEQPVAETAALAPKVEAAKTQPAQPVVEQAEAQPSSDAELEIARMAPITETVPAAPVVRDVSVQKVTMRKTQVQKGEPQDKGVFGIFSRALGYNANQAAAEKQRAQMVQAAAAPVEPQIPQEAIIRVTRPEMAEAEAPSQPQANQITAADTNRAAAFLDNIMAFHRPDGSDATGSAVAAARTRTTTVDTGNLNAIETAAGGPAMAAPVQPAAVMQQAADGQGIGLNALLQQAGLGNVAVNNGPNGTAQWTTGTVNGMYERQASQGNFDQQVASYLTRYQSDCPGKLQVSKGGIQPTSNGSVRVVDISCGMPGNSYATSIVFTQSPAGFTALLHAGQAGDSAQVNRIGDTIAGVLRSSGSASIAPVMTGGAVPASYAQQPAAAQSVDRPRFRIEIQAPSAAPEGIYDLPTTIVE